MDHNRLASKSTQRLGAPIQGHGERVCKWERMNEMSTWSRSGQFPRLLMDFHLAYVATSTNRFASAADICGSLVAFGSSSLVALWNIDVRIPDRKTISFPLLSAPQDMKRSTLPGHRGLVTCVRFISPSSFVSADDQGRLRIWTRQGSQARANSPCHHTNIYPGSVDVF